jgi:hypothetical protein
MQQQRRRQRQEGRRRRRMIPVVGALSALLSGILGTANIQATHIEMHRVDAHQLTPTVRLLYGCNIPLWLLRDPVSRFSAHSFLLLFSLLPVCSVGSIRSRAANGQRTRISV